MNGIWIRTQDKKRLVNCKDIEVIDCIVISNYDKQDYFKLGVYQTNERALKVLDEIQKVIEQNQTIMYEYVHSESKKIEYTYPQNVIYEMPKE